MLEEGVPAFGIIASTVLASIAMAISYLGSNGVTVFTTLVLMTGHHRRHPVRILRAGAAQMAVDRSQAGANPRLARDLIVAALALVFSILFSWYSRNTGHSFWVYWAPFFLAAGARLLGIPVYLRQRRHMTQPEPVPPYR